MTSLMFLAFLALTSSVSALKIQDPANELKASVEESELNEYDSNQEAELDELDRQSESEMLESFQPSAKLVSAWAAELQGKAESESQASQICLDDIMMKKTDHPECADPWDKHQVCKNSYEVPAYRLGDTFYEDHSAIPEYTKFYFPKSIAAKYLQTKKDFTDFPAMLKIINSTEYDNYEKPAEKEAVVHLRLGDAILRGKTYMLRNDSYYRQAARKMKQDGISSVVLVTGDHKIKQRASLNVDQAKGVKFAKDSNNMEQMTKQRMNEVEKVFEKQGMTVSKRINYNADCDVIYMANAHTFLKAGGKFSQLISKLVEGKGGKVLKVRSS